MLLLNLRQVESFLFAYAGKRDIIYDINIKNAVIRLKYSGR